MSTELRKEFTRYLQTKRYAAKTLEAYVDAVYGLAAYTLKPPDRLSNDDIQDYLHYLGTKRWGRT